MPAAASRALPTHRRRCTVDAIAAGAHRNVFSLRDPSLVLAEEEFRSRGRDQADEGREASERKRERADEGGSLHLRRLAMARARKSRRDDRRAKFMNLEPRFCPPTRFREMAA